MDLFKNYWKSYITGEVSTALKFILEKYDKHSLKCACTDFLDTDISSFTLVDSYAPQTIDETLKKRSVPVLTTLREDSFVIAILTAIVNDIEISEDQKKILLQTITEAITNA